MSEGTADFTASVPAVAGDVFAIPISDSITAGALQSDSEALQSADTDNVLAADSQTGDSAGIASDSEHLKPENVTTEEIAESRAAIDDSNVEADNNSLEFVEVTSDIGAKEAVKILPVEDLESEVELSSVSAEVVTEAPIATDATNLETTTIKIGQEGSEKQQLFPDDSKLFADDTDNSNVRSKSTAEVSSTSTVIPNAESIHSPSSALSTTYLSSGIPVDKLTTTSDLPQARLSPMRRIHSVPESSRPASVASNSTSADDSFASVDSQAAEPSDELATSQDLPPELISMADRFIESIHQITATANLSPDKLSELFQNFYVTIQDKASAVLRRNTLRRTYEVQMMSFEEIAKKKKERKQKEVQKLLYEDLVEKMVCEACYNEIFMFQGSDDEAKDSTLSSKIAALKLINIGMEHLGVPELKDIDIELCKMVDKHSPKEKLALLISAHKQIVDVLSRLTKTDGQDAHSGADFVLPTLIFSVIQADPPHIASNLEFIQRFRTAKTINGETAYCLTNFEAVVAFLETVDLATLKVDPGEIQALAARPLSSPTVSNPLAASPRSSINFVSSSPTTKSSDGEPSEQVAVLPSPLLPAGDGRRPANPPTRSSSLPAAGMGISQPFNNNMSMAQQKMDSSSKRVSFYPSDIAASAVNTADSGIKSLGSTFESSYKFLFGGRGGNGNASVAQKPVQMKGTANPAALEKRTQEVLQSSSALISAYTDGSKRESGIASPPPYPGTGSERTVPSSDLPSTGFSSTSRPRSLYVDDSNGSQASGSGFPNPIKRVGSNESTKTTRTSTGDEDGGRRSIFSNMRNFGRGALSKEVAIDPEILKSLPKIAPPLQKFDHIDNAAQLRLGDVDELMKDYKRLVEYLKSISAFEERL
ncbi:hypothetical protein V1525DRAFT_342731 [Lipomyces kononenkoae]|uniref:Uncharacterized protein n=1 Tax=Lipomyces kononenkoae TaxID=34357 RepID=A0ACC3T2R4_LIPKO